MKIYSTMDKNRDRCMMLDDETDDLNCSNFPSVGAERLPITIIENLSDIWIPAHLLKKKKNHASKNLQKPAIFRTLERVSENSFSVYEETVDQPESFSTADFAEEDMLDLLNNLQSLDDNDEVVSATEASTSSDNNVNLIKSRDSDMENLSPRNNSKTLGFSDKEMYDFVQSACLKTFAQSNEESVKNSLDDIYNSDDDLCENPCTLSEEVTLEENVAPLKISDSDPSECIAEKLQPHVEEGASYKPDFEGSLRADLPKGSEVEYTDSKELKESGGCTPLVNFTVAYKRPVIQDTVKKQKNQKKKKNAQKKNVLDLFSQNDDSGNPYPKVDEFYESVMRQKHQTQTPYECDYPSLQNEFPGLSRSQTLSTSAVTTEFEDFKETENPSMENTSVLENSRKKHNSNDNLGINSVIIILENLPRNVSKEQVQALLPIGKVRSLSKCGKFKIAEISLDNNAEADWIIDCFDGNRPFGAESSLLKCYKL